MKDILTKLKFILSDREKRLLKWLYFMMIIGGLLELIGVAGVMPLVTAIMADESYDRNYIVFLSLLIIGVYIVKNIYLTFMYKTIFKFVYTGKSKLSVRLFKTYLDKPYMFHLNRNCTVIQRAVNQDTDGCYKVVKCILQILAEIVICCTLAVFLVIISPIMAVAMIIILGSCMGAVYIVSKKSIRMLGEEDMANATKMNQWVMQGIGGIKETKILNREAYFAKHYEDYSDKSSVNLVKQQLWMQVPRLITENVTIIAVMFWIMVQALLQRDIAATIPTLAVFAVAAFRLLPSVGKINGYLSEYNYNKAKVDFVYSDLKEAYDDAQKDDSTHSELSDSDELVSFTESINLENVSFAYTAGKDNILNNANMCINRGESIGLVGVSGAGKTTLADIIMGLLRPLEGDIKADGKSIYENINGWYRQIGYVPQTLYLSDDTIRNNVAFAIEEEDIDDEKVWDVLKKAQLEEFVNSLPEGIDTIVGDRGIRLSGGQRQRIGIARALYHDSEVLILDEATSALDNDTEKAVMEAIETLHGKLTMIIIAHRLTTIEKCDRLYRVDDGKVYLEK